MGAEHQRLLDIGCLGGTGDKSAEPIGGGGDAIIGRVHIGHDILLVDHQDQVLADKRNDPFDHQVFGDPAGAILGNAKMGRQDGEVDIFQGMRVFQSGDLLCKGRFAGGLNG